MPTVPSPAPTITEPAVDPRGPRFAAWVSALVLAAVLLTASPWLAAAQAVVFGLGALAGPRYAPYAALYRFLYRTVLAGRLGPPATLEPVAPLRFAQGVGFAFAAVAAAGYAAGPTAVGVVATAAALVAALLNAVFGLCLACQLYPRLPVRLRRVLVRS